MRTGEDLVPVGLLLTEVSFENPRFNSLVGVFLYPRIGEVMTVNGAYWVMPISWKLTSDFSLRLP